MKHTTAPLKLDDVGFPARTEPCPECEAAPGEEHASWCLHDAETDDEDAEA